MAVSWRTRSKIRTTLTRQKRAILGRKTLFNVPAVTEAPGGPTAQDLGGFPRMPVGPTHEVSVHLLAAKPAERFVASARVEHWCVI
jgi:hypothetical protein